MFMKLRLSSLEMQPFGPVTTAEENYWDRPTSSWIKVRVPSHDTCKGLSNLSTKMSSLGLIKLINPTEFEASLPDNTVIYEARGAFVTPGIFDLHSHITVDAGSSFSSALQYWNWCSINSAITFGSGWYQFFSSSNRALAEIARWDEYARFSLKAFD